MRCLMAANAEWKRTPIDADRSIRAEFRLGLFPLNHHTRHDTPTPAPTP